MKKLAALWLVLLLCTMAGHGFAQAETDEFFRCQEGNITFILPGYPEGIFCEPDLPARSLENSYLAWQDKTQLTGFGDENGEYQVHIADLAPLIQWLQEDIPGQEMREYQANALMNMVRFYLAIHNGSLVGEVDAALITAGEKTYPQMTFSYTYPDAPDVPYRGKGYMDGSRAVVMMVLADESNLMYLDAMRPVSDGEAESFLKDTPETVTIDRVQFTFPETPVKYEADGYWLYQAFTRDYAYLSVEHMKADLSFMAQEGQSVDELLQELAEVTAAQYQSQGIITGYEVKKLAEGMYAFEALEQDTRYPQGHGPLPTHILGIFCADGIYTINGTDTEMGRAAMESIRYLEIAE